MMHDNPVPSTRLSQRRTFDCVAQGGRLGADCMAIEERRLDAMAMAAQKRMLQAHERPESSDQRPLTQRRVRAFCSSIIRIVPDF